MKLKAKLSGNLSFDIEQGDYTYTVDADPKHGGQGKGPAPKGLLLGGLIGCTGMDVASILQKMKVEYDDFEITAETEQTTEHPVVFKEIKMVYTFKGREDVDISKLKRAVELSTTKYCGVSAMLKKHSPISHKIYFNEKLIHEEK